jgi:D-alanine-D-alanine ligase
MRDALDASRYEVSVFDVASQSHEEKVEGATPLAWSSLASELARGDFDVVLTALHGGWGEDGTLQALLETVDVPYVGTPPRGSTIAMDKQLCKLLLREMGFHVPRGVLLETDQVGEDVASWNGACVVKPNGGGSSVGVTILPDTKDREALRVAVQAALADGSAALVEETVVGVEVTAPVVGTGTKARALPVVEVVPQKGGGFFDFEAKYSDGGAQHLIPPRLSEDVQKLVSEYSLRAHRALGCRGVSRSDFIVTDDGTPYFLEINTLPGMTATSLVPDAARAEGIEFPQLLDTLIADALGHKPTSFL